MKAHQDSTDFTPLAPETQHAQQMALMAHQVVIKLKEMGLPDDYDDELSAVCTDLGDLWGAGKALSDRLETMLKKQSNWESVADSLVDLRAIVDHMSWHINSIKEPMEKLAAFAYQQEGKE